LQFTRFSFFAYTESSSGGSSDWEKEFDLDMTEEEIDAALVGDDTNLDDVSYL